MYDPQLLSRMMTFVQQPLKQSVWLRLRQEPFSEFSPSPFLLSPTVVQFLSTAPARPVAERTFDASFFFQQSTCSLLRSTNSFCQRYSCLFSAVQTGNNHVWFSPLLCPNTTIHARQDKALTMSAHLAPVFLRQTDLRCHCYLSSRPHIRLSQSLIFAKDASCQTKKRFNTLFCQTPSVTVHSLHLTD
jgi:hypothetical protein